MRIVRSAAVVVLLVLVACSSDSSRNSSSSSSSPSGSSTGAGSSSASSTTTTAAATACQAADRPAAAVRLSEGSADVDGDGSKDAVSVYADGTSSAPGPWHVLVTLGAGRGRVATTITDAVSGDPIQRVELLGASSIADGPAEALFVAVGSGASATIVGLFSERACALTRLSRAPSSAPAQFAVGGTVTHLDGLRCRDKQLEQLSATSSDGVTYDARVQRLTIRDGALISVAAPAVAAMSAADSSLQEFSSVDCPGVTLP